MAVIKQVVFTQPTYHVALETTNQSFIDMYYYLINIGIPKEKANFMLRLYDESLIGINPFDKNLPLQIKQRIALEVSRNIWYFIRECVRVDTAAGKVRFELHRGNMAMIYLFERNYSFFVELPRQFGKTTASAVCYLWVFNFAARNSKILFFHKEHKGSKDNLATVKSLRDNLPEYLQMKADTIGTKGQKIKVPNTVETASNILTGNSIVTLPSARSATQAESIGRGKTCTFFYMDEYAFMPYNKIVYAAVYPAYSTASRAAASVGAHYGIIISTTPGDLTTQEGMSCYNLRNNGTPWNDRYYALSDVELAELHAANTNSAFWMISYSYTQLGRGSDYLKEMVIGMEKDWSRIRREVLLEWAQTSDNNPFGKEQLDKVEAYCKDPIRTLLFGKKQQYQFNVYEDIDLRYPPIIGVDVSGALYHDSSSITIIDSRTTKVCADFNCNYITADDLADLIYTLVTKFMPNSIVNIERNGDSSIYYRNIEYIDNEVDKPLLVA
jgi:hypothetical protein